MEAGRLRELGLFEVHPHEELGMDELVASGLAPGEVDAQLALRAVGSLGLKRASVPDNFPVWLADRLRAAGVELDVDQELFDDRRRAKTEAQIAGMRRAQRAAEAAMDACRELLRRSEIRGDELLLDGEQLTVERVKADMNVAFAAHDTTADEYIVAPGAQGAVGHDMGSGPIRPEHAARRRHLPARQRLGGLHRHDAHVRRRRGAGRRARVASPLQGGARPRDRRDPRRRRGARRLRRHVRDLRGGGRADAAHEDSPARRSRDGFFHGLGHGVGLEVHEEPSMGRLADKKLVAGDVVTVEPGLYRAGYGGVRLEDIVLVTERRRRGPHALPVRPRTLTNPREIG